MKTFAVLTKTISLALIFFFISTNLGYPADEMTLRVPSTLKYKKDRIPDFVEAVELAGSYGMTEESIAEFAKLIHMNLFKEGFVWEDCGIQKMDADPFTIYIGVEL